MNMMKVETVVLRHSTLALSKCLGRIAELAQGDRQAAALVRAFLQRHASGIERIAVECGAQKDPDGVFVIILGPSPELIDLLAEIEGLA